MRISTLNKPVRFARPVLRAMLVTAALLVLLCETAPSAAAQDNMTVYASTRENGWQDYSWSITEATTVYTGTSSLGVTLQGYGALYLYHYAFNPQLYTNVTFWINGGASGGQNLIVQATVSGTGQTPVAIPALHANTWQQVTIPLASLGVTASTSIDGFWIQNAAGNNIPEFYVANVVLTGATPPSAVDVSVNPSSVLRTVDDRLYGVNLAVWDPALNSASTGTLLSAMHTRIVRFPGGGAADNYDWQTDRSVIDGTFQWVSNAATFAQVTAAQNAQAIVTVNYGSGTPEEASAMVAYYNGATNNATSLGTDSKGRNWQTVGYWASIRAAAPLGTDDGYNFLRISHSAPFAFRYWEIGNECYGTWETDLHGSAGSGLAGSQWDAVTYANAFATFRQQMLAVDSTIQIGAVAAPGEDSFPGSHTVTNPVTSATHQGWTPVLLSTLHSLGIAPSFLIDHHYPQNPSYDGNQADAEECDATLLQSSVTGASDATDLRAQLTDYLGASAGGGVELTFTELNSTVFEPGKQGVSLVNGLFMADSIGELTQTEINACVWWDFRNGTFLNNNNSSWLYGWRNYGDYGVVASGDEAGVPLNTPYPPYYAATLLTHWARGGDHALATTSSFAGLSAYGALLANGNLAILVVNKSPTTDLTGQITTAGFTPGSATGNLWQYGKSNDLNSTGLTTGTFAASGSFNYVFPSYSMTVLVLTAPAPVITTVHGSQSVIAGNPVTFSITAAGVGSLSYQWYKNGSAISGATSSSYAIADASTGNTGNYSVTVTDSNGDSTSSTYTLTVSNPIPALPPWTLAALALLLFFAAIPFLRGKQSA